MYDSEINTDRKIYFLSGIYSTSSMHREKLFGNNMPGELTKSLQAYRCEFQTPSIHEPEQPHKN
ncbi:hypothetical protein BZL35_00058 [Candidatus Pandoraea novymonadis]|uniref:Uncharacterized protein n=1 Tax=Candidatus Pandoraea novymonadis TaxID=1808959 RepID=A0ABX5FEF8_9BURK|nr:hypothetical protein BZL35_00058 [Candidatus Pandoraea novymonadis]